MFFLKNVLGRNCNLAVILLEIEVHEHQNNLLVVDLRLVSCFDLSQRGNQRARDRERAQARAGNKPKNPKDDGLTPEQRRERDAKALQEKAARKAAQAANGGKENTNAGSNNKNNKKK